MPILTFSCCETFDRKVGFGESEVPCPSCGKAAKRESVYRVNFGGFSRTPSGERDYSRDYKHFQEAGAELEYKHSRLEEGLGKSIPPPPLYSMAKAKALDLKRKGAVDADDLS